LSGIALVLLWEITVLVSKLPPSVLPRPGAVLSTLGSEISSGRLAVDAAASLLRMSLGFSIALALGIPAGLLVGSIAGLRLAFAPWIAFFRFLSPLAWMPFAVLWFGVGHPPVVFLIALAAFFPLAAGTAATVARLPRIYFEVAEDFGISRGASLLEVTWPAALPEIHTHVRMAAGVSWVVLVAAEMLAGQDGLGYSLLDARNGLRTDVVVVEMIAIGLLGIGIDSALRRLDRLEALCWAYERKR
jgi:NitT/TauT family transport system permease protein